MPSFETVVCNDCGHLRKEDESFSCDKTGQRVKPLDSACWRFEAMGAHE